MAIRNVKQIKAYIDLIAGALIGARVCSLSSVHVVSLLTVVAI